MGKREPIELKPSDMRYIRRDEKGHFTDNQDDVRKSPIQDRRKHAKDEAPHGNRRDQCADSQKLVGSYPAAEMSPWSFLHRVAKALPEKMRINTFDDSTEKARKPQKDQYLGKGSRVRGS
jgi:hypothetical protein